MMTANKHNILALWIAALLSLLPVVSFSQDCTAHRGDVKDAYNFWFYSPEESDDANVHRPLLVFLHGASLCGKNMNKVRKYGPMDALKRGRVIDCYIVAPQNPGGAWNPRKVMNIIEWVEANYPVDSDRIYIYGMSLGGYGTLDMCAIYPDRIACGMALCGGATVKDLSGLTKMPLWIVHGTADKAVPISCSDKVVAEMKKSGDISRLIYTKLRGANHGAPARIFYLGLIYDWMFSHSLKDEGRPVNRDFEITNELLRNAYSDLGKNKMEAFE